jgi:hypothetical protein
MNKRLALAFGVASCFLTMISLAACGVSTANSTSSHPTLSMPANETLYVLAGTPGGQRLVAIRAGGEGGGPPTLPAGLVTQDHLRMYVATSQGARTVVTTFDTRSGATVRSFTIDGNYATDAIGYGSSTRSPDGHWLALRQLAQMGGDQSMIAVVDTQAMKVVPTIQLSGDFALDALSPDGSVLYLLQNLHDVAHHYYVRAYDLGIGKLLPQIIVDKTEIDHPQMRGSAVARRMGDGGTAAFTLYVDPLRNTAFVHVLPLSSTGNILPFARCVDGLPASTSANVLRGYTLVLSADGSTLFAVNAALGVASRITVNDGGVLNAHVSAASHFEPMGALNGDYGAEGILSNGAALSPDGATLYVAGAHGLQVIRTSDMKPIATYLPGHALTGVALSARGNLLYIIDVHNGVLLLRSDGTQSTQVAIPNGLAPQSIAWVDK